MQGWLDRRATDSDVLEGLTKSALSDWKSRPVRSAELASSDTCKDLESTRRKEEEDQALIRWKSCSIKEFA